MYSFIFHYVGVYFKYTLILRFHILCYLYIKYFSMSNAFPVFIHDVGSLVWKYLAVAEKFLLQALWCCNIGYWISILNSWKKRTSKYLLLLNSNNLFKIIGLYNFPQILTLRSISSSYVNLREDFNNFVNYREHSYIFVTIRVVSFIFVLHRILCPDIQVEN